jgi:hypothetical protein
MTGSEPRYTDDLDTVLHTVGDFTIHPCKYRAEKDDDTYVDGYAVRYVVDGVVQMRVPAIAQAISSIHQWDEILRIHKATVAAQDEHTNTEGLLTDTPFGDDDVIN